MGSHPGTLSGMPNVSEPEFCTPIGSPEMRGVVGTPLFILRMLPNCHPPSTPFANPARGPGTCQRPLMTAVCVTLKSETARLMDGANQNQVVMDFEKASPAMVAELSSIDLLYV